MKARFFLAHDFKADDPQALANALAAHAIRHWPGTPVVTRYAVKRVLVGLMPTPIGYDEVQVLSVWQIKADGKAWLVTARPAALSDLGTKS